MSNHVCLSLIPPFFSFAEQKKSSKKSKHSKVRQNLEKKKRFCGRDDSGIDGRAGKAFEFDSGMIAGYISEAELFKCLVKQNCFNTGFEW